MIDAGIWWAAALSDRPAEPTSPAFRTLRATTYGGFGHGRGHGQGLAASRIGARPDAGTPAPT